mmetsp:Transcript_13579/g.25894  ORF Transcript_13579/g.25894 Transcript_13579/m.25894 type:complete len:113 (+) Transcript_13579:371-709(+)
MVIVEMGFRYQFGRHHHFELRLGYSVAGGIHPDAAAAGPFALPSFGAAASSSCIAVAACKASAVESFAPPFALQSALHTYSGNRLVDIHPGALPELEREQVMEKGIAEDCRP